MTYRTELPDFDFEVPALISESNGWEDISWDVEGAARFQCDVFELFIEYSDRTRREFPDGPQFAIHCEGETYLETDEWEDVRAFIEDGKRHFPEYVRLTLDQANVALEQAYAAGDDALADRWEAVIGHMSLHGPGASQPPLTAKGT